MVWIADRVGRCSGKCPLPGFLGGEWILGESPPPPPQGRRDGASHHLPGVVPSASSLRAALEKEVPTGWKAESGLWAGKHLHSVQEVHSV